MPHVGHFSLSILEAWPHRTKKGHLPAETGSRHPASVMEGSMMEGSMMEGARKRRPRMAPTEVMRAPRLTSIGTHGCRSSMPRGSVWFRMLTPIRSVIQHPFPEPSNSFGEDGPGLTRWVLESDGFLTEVVERRCAADWNPMTRSSLIIPPDINPPSPRCDSAGCGLRSWRSCFSPCCRGRRRPERTADHDCRMRTGAPFPLGSDQTAWPKRSRRSPRRRRSRYADIATPRRPLSSHALFQRVQISGLVRLGPACRRYGTCWPTRIER